MPHITRSSFLKNSDNAYRSQQGEVSLQTVFWIVGIIVGLLTIVQIVITLINNQSEPEATEVSVVQDADTKSSSKEDATIDSHIIGSDMDAVIQTPPKPAALDTQSIKVDNYTAYSSGVVVDEEFDVMWMRCSLGQQWNGTDCEGDALTYDIDHVDEALNEFNVTGFAGFYDWQVPDIQALHSIVYCSKGFDDSYEIIVGSGWRKKVDIGCMVGHSTPTIKANVFPNTQYSILRGYLSSSIDDTGKPLAVYFNTGRIKAKDKPHFIRPMRRIK